MSELSDAIDTLFDDPLVGVDALYTPAGGETVEVRARLYRPRERDSLFTTGTRRATRMAEVPITAIPTRPADGDGLVVGAESWTIRSAEPDSAGVRWQLDLDPAA